MPITPAASRGAKSARETRSRAVTMRIQDAWYRLRKRTLRPEPMMAAATKADPAKAPKKETESSTAGVKLLTKEVAAMVSTMRTTGLTMAVASRDVSRSDSAVASWLVSGDWPAGPQIRSWV